ncbi:hypothetical protein [Xanthomonas graminis]|uniref:hypothetical protein n=1 Tax=Xanthomonas graminis TaxID=3390026 RepID=UPI0009BF4059|nr:hypothetical protein [Xanthomonas translucens]UKE76681.1 hypothetical protein KM317_14580 [Xanthomonas translucens pv. arrhenatheri]
MVNVDRKLLIVELVKRHADGQADSAQYVHSHWICDASEMFGFDGTAFSLERAFKACSHLLAADESEVHESWKGAFDEGIWEVLESAGTVDGLNGVAVLEVVLHSRAGPVFSARPRRFLVIQRGTNNAIYACDNLMVAFSLAGRLSNNLAIDGDFLAIERTSPSNRYGVG